MHWELVVGLGTYHRVWKSNLLIFWERGHPRKRPLDITGRLRRRYWESCNAFTPPYLFLKICIKLKRTKSTLSVNWKVVGYYSLNRRNPRLFAVGFVGKNVVRFGLVVWWGKREAQIPPRISQKQKWSLEVKEDSCFKYWLHRLKS